MELLAINYFRKNIFIIDVWQRSEYTFELTKQL